MLLRNFLKIRENLLIHIRLNMRKMNLKNMYYEIDGWHHDWLNYYPL